jgi:hypothetical protein
MNQPLSSSSELIPSLFLNVRQNFALEIPPPLRQKNKDLNISSSDPPHITNSLNYESFMV